MKRAHEDDDPPAAVATDAPPAKRNKRKKKRDKERAEAEAEAALANAGQVEEEEGEIDEFADLFMVDLTPSAVLPDPTEVIEEEAGLEAWKEVEKEQQSALEKEEAQMRAFASEVADSDEDDSDDEDEDEEETVADVPVYDDPEALQKAIQGKIVDDSAAKVRFGTLLLPGRVR